MPVTREATFSTVLETASAVFCTKFTKGLGPIPESAAALVAAAAIRAASIAKIVKPFFADFIPRMLVSNPSTDGGIGGSFIFEISDKSWRYLASVESPD